MNSACSRSRSAGLSAGRPRARARARLVEAAAVAEGGQGLVEGGGGGPVVAGEPGGGHGRLGHQPLGRLGALEERQLGFEAGDGAGGVVVPAAGGPLVGQADLLVEPGHLARRAPRPGGGGR